MSAELIGAVGDGKKAFTTSEAWNDRADTYLAHMMNPDNKKIRFEVAVGRKLMIDRVEEALKDEEKAVVLDVASGGGEPALSIAKACPHAEVHGTDVSPKMVEFIRERAEKLGVPNLKTAVENAATLEGFDDASVDVVTCAWGLESLSDPRIALQQFHRVLRGGGVALFAALEWTENAFMVKVYNVMEELTGASMANILPLGKDEGAVAKKEMEEVGFEDVKVSRVMLPIFAPATTGYRELFDFFTKRNPLEVAIAMMEKNGRPTVREEAYALFEASMEKDKAEGRAPPGPGLAAPGEPAHDEKEPVVFLESLIVEGRKRNGI